MGYSAAERGGEPIWQAAVIETTELLKELAFPKFFESAASSLAKLLGADGAALIVREGTEFLKYRLFYGVSTINHGASAEFRFRVDEGTVGRAMRNARYLFTPDYPASAEAMPEFVAAGVRANLVIPVPGTDGILGAIALSWIGRPAPDFDSKALRVGEMYAALLGSALYRETLEMDLQSLSLQDSLTGLPNRRMLMLRLDAAQRRAARHQRLLVLAMVDLDGFKQLNDGFGHAQGDEVLITAATRVRELIRATDMVARLGGDEFVILLEDIGSVGEAKYVLERIVAALRLEVKAGERELRVSASIGATIYPLDLSDPQKLLGNADAAMYVAKRQGGDGLVLNGLLQTA
ncbi:MAG: GGDEF domain-containing protein [Acidocella sp. 20-61-6]|nr:MAG: GGDEF domain-containing protein [Acidocella sp. 20-61-6]